MGGDSPAALALLLSVSLLCIALNATVIAKSTTKGM